MDITEKKIEDLLKRKQIQGSWESRIDSLGRPRASFCDKHSIHPSFLCRLLKFELSAGWKTINKIEAALKSEEV